MHDIDPATMQSWTPYAILSIVLVLVGIIGTAAAWMSSKGMTAYIKWHEYRRRVKAELLKEKEQQEADRRAKEKQKKLIDKFIEGKLTAEGYRALLLMYDQRLQDLEAKDKEKTQAIIGLNQQLTECLQKHATEKAVSDGLQNLLEEMNNRYSMLEEKCENLLKKLQRITGNSDIGRVDPYPSPLPHATEPEGEKDG